MILGWVINGCVPVPYVGVFPDEARAPFVIMDHNGV